MTNYLYLALLVLTGIIFGILVWKSKSKQESPHQGPFDRQESFHINDEQLAAQESTFSKDDTSTSAAKRNLGNLLTISVFAKENTRFSSYDLLQAITGTGMQFGEMNIFHYYHRDPQGKKITLFSLASATKPGDFDLDRIGDFSCVGLTLFMDITQVPNPLQAFYLMANIAEELAEDLDGELRLDPRTAWTEEHFKSYEQRIMQASELTENA